MIAQPDVDTERGAHLPVMAGEVLDLLPSRPDVFLADLTVGAGGHAEAFLRASAPTGRLFGADRDEHALALARERLASFGDRVELVRADSAAALALLAERGSRPDAILLDLGVSSMQLDDPLRGFTLRDDGPLDMRMDPTGATTAADLLNTLPAARLAELLADLGDEPRAARLAEAIVARRAERPFRRTGDLRRLVEEVTGRRGGRIHPATRTFMALRIAVNDELGLLDATLPAALERLAPAGRLIVIAFHSGEDRRVKNAFAAAARAGRGRSLTPRPLRPGAAERRANRRARSARLRAFERDGEDAA